MAESSHTLEDANLPKAPTILQVDRKDLFGLATRRLGFAVQTEKALQVGAEFIGVIKIDNIPERASLERENKEFYGEFCSTADLAIQSAYHAALGYLEKEKMVTVSDYSSKYITQLKDDVITCHKSWAIFHQVI